MQVKLFKPRHFQTNEFSDGISQILEVENTGGETACDCYAVMTVENLTSKIRIKFKLLYDLGGGMHPKLTAHALEFLAMDDHTNLIPHVPVSIYMLVVGKRRDGSTVINFQGGEISDDIPIEAPLIKPPFLDLYVHFSGENYQDVEPRRFKLDLTVPWDQMQITAP